MLIIIIMTVVSFGSFCFRFSHCIRRVSVLNIDEVSNFSFNEISMIEMSAFSVNKVTV